MVSFTERDCEKCLQLENEVERLEKQGTFQEGFDAAIIEGLKLEKKKVETLKDWISKYTAMPEFIIIKIDEVFGNQTESEVEK